jgi:transcriptional regulator with XRE-family HTH domain
MSVTVRPSVTSNRAIARAVGDELREARNGQGWSRVGLVAELPSGIGERTLLSYEHGTRHLTVVRLIEICHVLGVDAPALLRDALQRARIHLENLSIRVDLNALVKDANDRYRPMLQWARNALNEHPSGITEVEPAVVKNLALFVGCDYTALAKYLARFIPKNDD